MRAKPVSKIIRRSNVYVSVVQLEEIDVPHVRTGLPALLRSFGRHPSPVKRCAVPPEARQGEGWRSHGESNPGFSLVRAASGPLDDGSIGGAAAFIADRP